MKLGLNCQIKTMTQCLLQIRLVYVELAEEKIWEKNVQCREEGE